MEATRDFIACGDAPCGDAGLGLDPARPSGADGACSVECLGGVEGMDGALAVLRAVSATAGEDAASWGFRAASDFAGRVEEISRTAEYLQLVAAAAVDRTRKESTAAAAASAAGAATSWTTGWRESPAGWETGPSGASDPAGTPAAGTADAACLSVAGDGALSGSVTAAGDAGEAGAAADDGFRNTVEFLRARLRIGAAEARRRLSLAEGCCPGPGSPDARHRPRTRSSPPPSRPGRSPPGPRASSRWRWIGSGPCAAPTPRPGWNTP